LTTKSNIARLLGVSRAAVTRWHRRGMPVDSAEAAFAWHAANIRTRRKRREAPSTAPLIGPDADPPACSWRDRLDRANARVRETDLAVRRGELLPSAKVLADWQRLVSMFRARALAIPSRIAVQLSPGVRERVAELVEREIREALAELSGVGDGDD
jgi:phage terminase Nu1 subunit (DNA packaging protein)